MDLLTRLEELPRERFENDRVILRKVENEDDVYFCVEECRLPRSQRDMVNSAGFGMGRAWLKPKEHVPYVIRTRQGKPVGFMMLNIWEQPYPSTSWSFFIDGRFQHQGYGSAAAKCAVAVLRAAFPDLPICLSVEESNKKAVALYSKLGFRFWGEYDGDEQVYVLK